MSCKGKNSTSTIITTAASLQFLYSVYSGGDVDKRGKRDKNAHNVSLLKTCLSLFSLLFCRTKGSSKSSSQSTG